MSGLSPDGVLAGQVALVTGAARNIGAATAVAIAAAGGRVLATDIEPEGLAATAARIRAAQGDGAVATRVADLAVAEAADELVAAAVAEHGGLDIVVHAACDHGRGRIEELTVEQWHRTYAVNVAAGTWLVRAALPQLERSRGSVVLFSSALAQGGIPGCSLYGSTKAAIDGLTKHLAVELGPRGIRVNAISPGRVTGDPTADPTELPAYPLGRYGNPDDVASVVVFLASGAAKWMTGSVTTVDGGTTALNPGQAIHAATLRPPMPRWARAVRRFGGRSRR